MTGETPDLLAALAASITRAKEDRRPAAGWRDPDVFMHRRCTGCGNSFHHTTDHVPGSAECDEDRRERIAASRDED